MRVLAVGATGHVGSRVIPELLSAGHEVYAAARDTSALADLWWHDLVKEVEIDGLHAESARAALGQGIDAVVYLVVTVVPDWMQHQVEPIAVNDLAQAIVGALSLDSPKGNFDVGGGERILYSDLVRRYTEIAGKDRLQITVGLLPEKLVAQIASWIANIPSPTVKALMESLQHDMVAEDSKWRSALLPAGYRTVTTDDAIVRALADPGDIPDSKRDPLQSLTSDPEWAS